MSCTTTMFAEEPLVQPLDEANQRLLAATHPSGWVNPPSHGVYDLVVIGGGTAGLVTALIAGSVGARVAHRAAPARR